MRILFTAVVALLVLPNLGCREWTISHIRSADEILNGYMRAGEFSGVVLVASGDEVIFRRAYGLADREHGIPNSIETRFRIASLSKLMTRTAVLALQEKGVLRLDEPVADLLPDYPRGRQILISHLLEHTSGIPDIHNGDPVFTTEGSLHRHRSLPELVNTFRSRPLRFAPGTRTEYSNSGYILLAHLIEIASRRNYFDVLREKVFARAQMSDSGVDENQPIPLSARGYRRSGGAIRPAPDYDMSNYVGSGNLNSTADDLFRWEQALTSGALLQKETVRQFGSTNHLGRIAGFRTALFRFPSHVTAGQSGIVIIILSNLEQAPVETIASEVLGSLVQERAKTPAAEMRAILAGTYSGAGPNGAVFQARIFRDGDRLLMSYSNHTAQLLHLGGPYLYALEERRLQPFTIRVGSEEGSSGVRTLAIDEGGIVLQLRK